MTKAGKLNVEVITHVDDTKSYTVVTVHTSGHTGIGVSKRNPRDEYNSATGQLLALSRAMRDLGRNIERLATA